MKSSIILKFRVYLILGCCLAIILSAVSCCSNELFFLTTKTIRIPEHNLKIEIVIKDDKVAIGVLKNGLPFSHQSIENKTDKRSFGITFFDENGITNDIYDLNGDGIPDHKDIGTGDNWKQYAFIEGKFQEIETSNDQRKVNGKLVEFRDGRYRFISETDQ